MNNNDYPPGADCSWAPWNEEEIKQEEQEEIICPDCGSTAEVYGTANRDTIYICTKCKETFIL